MLRLLPLLALAAALALAACADGDDGAERAATGATTAEAPTTDTAPTTTAPESPPTDRPGRVLTRFVRAASAENTTAMWELLSVASQRRLGPSLPLFRSRTGRTLARQIGAFLPGRSRVFLEEPITSLFAVAAYGGRTNVGAKRPFASYAVALRLEDDGWRIELGGPVELEPLGPDPGRTESGAFQIAAGAKANAAIVEAGLWLDAEAVPGRTSGLSAQDVTMFSDAQGRIQAGPHAIVAFAATFADASALAWNFVYR